MNQDGGGSNPSPRAWGSQVFYPSMSAVPTHFMRCWSSPVRTLGSQPRGHGFESRTPYFGSVAQMAERLVEAQGVGGSIPSGTTMLRSIILVVIMALMMGASGESTTLTLINAERGQRGLSPLSLSVNLSQTARNHSKAMAESHSLWHSGKAAEIVGRGPSVETVFIAFMASPGHRSILLGDYETAAVGVYSGNDGFKYVTVMFFGKSKDSTRTVQPPASSVNTEPTRAKAPKEEPKIRASNERLLELFARGMF